MMRYTLDRLIAELTEYRNREGTWKHWVDFQTGLSGYGHQAEPTIRTNINRIDKLPGRIVIVIEKGL